ncbi:hypothetical protein OIU76_007449 [Salix suchowensis]|nr:hypothetical protein OIU76_007449 [Salix suchowensis]
MKRHLDTRPRLFGKVKGCLDLTWKQSQSSLHTLPQTGSQALLLLSQDSEQINPMALEAFNSPATATPSFQFEDSSLHYMGEPWAKRKRSKRSRLDQQPTEEEYLALCLVMLARGSTNLPIPASDQHPKTPDHPASSIHIIRAKIKLQVLRVQQGVSFLPSPRRAQSKVHECSICHKKFPTGQALGGHKRCHYEGIIGGAEKSGVTSTSEALPEFSSDFFVSGDDEVMSPLPAAKKLRILMAP